MRPETPQDKLARIIAEGITEGIELGIVNIDSFDDIVRTVYEAIEDASVVVRDGPAVPEAISPETRKKKPRRG